MFQASLRGQPASLAISLIVTFCMTFSTKVRAAAYTILDLGTLGGSFVQSNGFGGVVNASGQVAGYSYTSTAGITHAFRTAPNSPITPANDLGVLGVGMESSALAINDSGQAVGNSTITADPDGPAHAFRTTPGGVITAASDLGTLGGTFSIARGINASGQAVGNSFNASGVARAFRTTATGPITPNSDLGSLGGTRSFAYNINASGQTVGSSFLAGDAIQHAYRTSANGLINAASDLGTLGGTFGRAHDVNISGQAVGTSTLADNVTQHAFRTAVNGVITPASDLGTLGGNLAIAYGVNSPGQTVGMSSTLTANHAFLSDVSGAMQDLNDLIPSGGDWELQEAHGINDLGQIAGFGTIGGQTHSFLLTPTPEPATLSFLGIGGIGLLGRRRRAQRA